jgi:hypothetical protein
MDSRSIDQAKALANRFKAGAWPCPGIEAILTSEPHSGGESQLKLNGITVGGKFSLCLINGKSLIEGDSARIPFGSRTVLIRCLKIEKESVLIAVEGEDAPRSLHLR